MFDVQIDSKARNFLSKCNEILFNRILLKINKLTIKPVPKDAKRIVNKKILTFRLRIGDYRVLYCIDFKLKEINVVSIDHRKNIYK